MAYELESEEAKTAWNVFLCGKKINTHLLT